MEFITFVPDAAVGLRVTLIRILKTPWDHFAGGLVWLITAAAADWSWLFSAAFPENIEFKRKRRKKIIDTGFPPARE